VYRVSKDLRVGDLQRYGREARRGAVRAGSYWIPLAQPQKRWIQALLGEDTYVPFPYFYDVTAWSNPLLMNLDAAFSASKLAPKAQRVTTAPAGGIRGNVARASFFSFPGATGRAVAAALDLARGGVRVLRLRRSASVRSAKLPAGTFLVPAGGEAAIEVEDVARRHRLLANARSGPVPPGDPVDRPKVAVYAPPTASPAVGGESLGHLRFLLERVWRVPYTPMTGAEVTAGALSAGQYDVFIVPGVETLDLAAAGQQIRSWIEGGGVYVGTARPGDTGGTPYAVANGYTSSSMADADGMQIPGSLFRVDLGGSSPLTLGAPSFVYWFHLGESVLTRSATGLNAGVYPKKAPDFWFSGYAKGQGVLEGSAALVDERLGAGHVVLFSGEPNYRAFTEGSAFLLANALAYPAETQTQGVDVGSAQALPAVRTAMRSARAPFGPGRPIQLEVPTWQAAAALAVTRRFEPAAWVERGAGGTVIVIANPAGLDVERHPFSARRLPALWAAGVEVRAAIL
ncbi:MAG: hypothetical protein ABR518_08335, partial [Actinomycetota bacterium]